MMKDNLNELVHGFFEKKEPISFPEIVQLIEEQMRALAPLLNGAPNDKQHLLEELQEKIIKFPKIKITEKWGEKHNEDREIFEEMMQKVKGNTVEDKINSVNEFLAYKRGLPVAEILSNLMFVEIFSTIIEEFNASTAGFLFEAFLAGLFAGEQIADPEQVGAKPGSLPIEDVTLAIRQKDQPVDTIVPYSLKVLSPSVDLKGSFVNIVDYFASGRQDNIVYLVVTKFGQGTLAFNEFTITQDNFLDYIGHEKYDKQRVYDDTTFTPATDAEVKDNKLVMNNLVIGSSPTRGKQTSDGLVRAPASRAPKRAIAAYQELPEEERVYFKASAGVTRDPYNLTINGRAVQAGELIDMTSEHNIQIYSGEDKLVAVGGMTANAKKLYGDEETFKNLLASKKDAGFWESLKSTKGYLTNQQFHISPGNVRGRSELIGRLDLHPPKLIKLANQYAEDLGESLVDLYNAVSNLSININKYFIGSDKLAGRGAIKDAHTIKSESENLIKVE